MSYYGLVDGKATNTGNEEEDAKVSENIRESPAEDGAVENTDSDDDLPLVGKMPTVRYIDMFTGTELNYLSLSIKTGIKWLFLSTVIRLFGDHSRMLCFEVSSLNRKSLFCDVFFRINSYYTCYVALRGLSFLLNCSCTVPVP
jgi:hypothetical protein